MGQMVVPKRKTPKNPPPKTVMGKGAETSQGSSSSVAMKSTASGRGFPPARQHPSGGSASLRCRRMWEIANVYSQQFPAAFPAENFGAEPKTRHSADRSRPAPIAEARRIHRKAIDQKSALSTPPVPQLCKEIVDRSAERFAPHNPAICYPHLPSARISG